MNALALLCNLHADGPRTLQRLRRVGCESLAELVDRTAIEVSEALETDREFAERFQREAAHLLERVEGGLLAVPKPAEPQAGGGPGPAQAQDQPAGAPAFPPGPEAARSGAEGDANERDASAAAEPLREPGGEALVPRPVESASHSERIGPVLETWRALDRSSPLPDPDAVRADEGDDPGGDCDLEDAGLPSMSRDLLIRFDAAGAGTLRRLLDASALELSRTLPLAFTRVKRFQSLAAKVLEEREAPPLTPRRTHGHGEWAPRAEAGPEPSRGSDSKADASKGSPPREEPDSGPDWVESAGPFA